MIVVIDASVALKWVLQEPGSEAAAELHRDSLIAPSLWIVEAANALWRMARRGQISIGVATERLVRLRRAPVRVIDNEFDVTAALDLALELNHPVYDCLYLALAVREGVHVVTADQRFHSAARASERFGSVVRMLGAPASHSD